MHVLLFDIFHLYHEPEINAMSSAITAELLLSNASQTKVLTAMAWNCSQQSRRYSEADDFRDSSDIRSYMALRYSRVPAVIPVQGYSSGGKTGTCGENTREETENIRFSLLILFCR